MNLFIQIKDGMPINYPAFEDNLIEAFGRVPDDWEPFVRVPCPQIGIYEVLTSDQPVYEKINEVWQDVWLIRPMTDEEKATKQQIIKDQWNNQKYAANYTTWLFDEPSCSFVPPFPRPAPIPGVRMYWCGAINNWRETPPYPDDGQEYAFNYFEWQWELKTNV